MPDGTDSSVAVTVAPPLPLRVGGFVPFTTTDYPDALAAVVFCQGCPWRCAYCHNPHLQPPRGDAEDDFARILDWLSTRRRLLDAVVFSGGEPTAQAALGRAIDDVRAQGLLVGLHTGGAYPRRLASVLPRVDWVGFDVKAPGDAYSSVTSVDGSGRAALASLDLVLAAGVAYEVRTTVHPQLTPAAALMRLAGELASRGVIRWALQPFRPTGCADEALVAAAPRGATLDDALLTRLSARVPIIDVRG
ncbi:MAG: anaerobic ribonucleoside-triphosphate reductase activating protein [Burkholderiales bacterium]|nr:anaerobic ribonucleoside-triphosphate reductase activating protein [Burkholderiales bacterium]